MGYDIYETGQGGDILVTNNGVENTSAIYAIIYVTLFGGNEDNSDYWANDLCLKNNPEKQYKGNLEYKLKNTSLTPSGLEEIKDFALNLLKQIEYLATFTVEIRVVNNNLKIIINAFEPETNKTDEIIFVWNATKNEIIKQI